MRDLDAVFAGLAGSAFRRRFRLSPAEQGYVANKGLPVVLDHARTIIERRLAAARPLRDGKQTPFRGHPVFVAQHATATCCRGCLEKWYRIPRGQALTADECDGIVQAVARWLGGQGQGDAAGPLQGTLRLDQAPPLVKRAGNG